MVRFLQSRPPCKEGEKLSRHTSLGVGGIADMFFAPRNIGELTEEIAWLNSRSIPFRVIGGGTNIACHDSGYRGAIINTKSLNRAWHEGNKIRAQAGCNLALLVKRSSELGLSGLEPLVGIPGTVGGAVIMNAGGKHGNIGHLVEEVRTLTFEGEERVYRKPVSRFSYRKGDFNGEVIAEILLNLNSGASHIIRKKLTEIMREKFAAQPLSARSAGCVFKNPTDKAAGALIDKCGLKEMQVGGMKISPVHANFIINESCGKFSDFIELAELAKSRVKESFGVELEYEIKVI